ncbi:MAG: Ig-like domain-containing protein [Lachnospiraceae bacterium]|nr:Ig-like domain-containing protein [Lachnospiraceae bacterium]
MKEAGMRNNAGCMGKIFYSFVVMLLLLIVSSATAEATTSTSVKVLKAGKSYTVSGCYKAKSSKKPVASTKKVKTGKYRITAKKKGTATVTVYDKNGKVAKKIYLLVTDSSSFKYNTNKLSLEIGESKTAKATVQGGCSVKYKSSDSSVAKVSSKGKITAVKSGTSTISAKVYYKGKCVKTMKKTVTVTGNSSVTSSDAEEKTVSYPGYTYEVYLVAPSDQKVYSYPDSPLYAGTGNTLDTYCFYIKTQNTKLSSFSLFVNGEAVTYSSSKVTIKSVIWDDIQYENNQVVNGYRKVSGGYVINLSFPSAGTYTFEVAEWGTTDKTKKKVVTSFSLKVLDYEESETEWIDSLVAAHTTGGMDSFEKMESVCSYLRSSASGFTYLSNDDGISVSLAAEYKGPYFETKQWDSYISPAILARIAERIGGFTYIHNCYSDYTKGSEAWQTTHYLLKYGVDGDIREISVCPAVATGEIGTLTYINFGSTSQMVRLG